MPPAVATPAVPALDPLSAAERESLKKLLARDSATGGPAGRIGEPYEALANLSVPRRGDADRQSDLVVKGETVYLTDEEARKFNRRDPGRDGRMTEVVRKLSGPDGSREPAPRLLPRHLSGRLFRPMTPPPNSDLARPDPPESSEIQVYEDGRAPEAAGSMSPEPGEMADHLSAAAPDALDLPPTRNRARAR
jgi:hypothetical protein